MKNRTIIGIVCIVLALVVTFAVVPLVSKLSDSRTDIVRLKSDIVQGHMIQESDIEIVTVGSTGLPANIITKKEAVVGKFAACDLKANTDLLQSISVIDGYSSHCTRGLWCNRPDAHKHCNHLLHIRSVQ